MPDIKRLRFTGHGIIAAGADRSKRCKTGEIGEFDVAGAYFREVLVPKYGDDAFEPVLEVAIEECSAGDLKGAAVALGAKARKTRTKDDALNYLRQLPHETVERVLLEIQGAHDAAEAAAGSGAGDPEGGEGE